MNIRDLRYLVAIVEGGTLRAASQRVHVTQPALTKCVERLEHHIGAALFDRRGRHIVPTEVGDVLVRRARAILQSIDETQREVSDYASGQRGHVRLGAAATLTEFMVPDIISQMSQDLPNVTIELMVGMSDVLRDALRQGKLDIVLGPKADTDEFDFVPIEDDEVVVVASSSHPLAGRDISLDELQPFRWVLPPRSVTLRAWLEQAFQQLGLPAPRVQVEVNSLVRMPSLIARTELLSFVSSRNLSATRNEGQIVSLKNDQLIYRRSFGALTGKGSYVPLAAQKVLQILHRISGSAPAFEENAFS